MPSTTSEIQDSPAGCEGICAFDTCAAEGLPLLEARPAGLRGGPADLNLRVSLIIVSLVMFMEMLCPAEVIKVLGEECICPADDILKVMVVRVRQGDVDL